jgi:hypothetical protein
MRIDNEIIDKFMKDPSNDSSIWFTEELQYDSSWNWIMPVVEKINSKIGKNSLYDGVRINKDTVYLSAANFNLTTTVGVGENRHKNMLEALYTACLEYIEWSNNK